MIRVPHGAAWCRFGCRFYDVLCGHKMLKLEILSNIGCRMVPHLLCVQTTRACALNRKALKAQYRVNVHKCGTRHPRP